ncbi:MAG TPA: DNA repair protein RadA [Dehalococcoidia bacterium]|nr:DNA repair protein RadA [Dehalococcoidia bacterium]
MAKIRARTVFICQQCGAESPKWLGRCPDCSAWNSLVESLDAAPVRSAGGARVLVSGQPEPLSRPIGTSFRRYPVGIGELDRVLGGGFVPGSLVLIGGDPGIGKSTLLLQAGGLTATADRPVLYVSGEESTDQIRLRAQRLGITGDHLYLLCETNLATILDRAADLSSTLLVVDSIQTVYLDELSSSAGTVGQIRESGARLAQFAKKTGQTVFIVGHVTKEGAIAGPKVLEHLVDTVLYLEGERFHTYRLLRGVKNRFGSTNEVGVFEMSDAGLAEVANPSELFLAHRDPSATGSSVVVTLEGTRPILVEIQALTTGASYGMVRRTANGIDPNRLLLLTAVLSKRLGLGLSSQDIFVNVVGGFRINEPAADLGVALSIVSSFRNRPVEPAMGIIGEIGLIGELRPVGHIERRLAELARLGFRKCLLPRAVWTPRLRAEGLTLLPASTLAEAIEIGLT